MRGPAGVGLIAAVLAFVSLAIIAHGVGTPAIDRDFSSWIRDHPVPLINKLLEAALRTGPVVIAAGAAAVAFLLRGNLRSALLMLLVIFVMNLSYALKEIVASPRPNGTGDDWGFPAGRAGNAVLLFGALATVLPVPRRNLRILIAGVLVLLVGWARVASGAQWASDVLGAWLWSVPALAASVAAVRHLFPENGTVRR
jgi:membrane-associated phospholipid phosphatase